MKVIVAGGRDYTDSATFFREMDRIHAERRIDTVIEGGQRTYDPETREVVGGADYWANEWARIRLVETVTVHADWKGLGRSAGPRRNQAMIDKYKPDAAIIFKGGAGTADMTRRAYECGLEVIKVST